jgi:ABC-type glycerol-3-phosphate transport system substrate-binding protein
MTPVAFQSDAADEQMWTQRVVYAYDPYPWPSAQEAGWSMAKYYEYFGKGLNPRFADGEIATQAGGYLLGIPKTAIDPALSWEFIKLSMQPEYIRDLAIAQQIIPTMKSVAKYTDQIAEKLPYYKLYLESQKYTHFNLQFPQAAKLFDPIYTAIQEATLQKASAKEALDRAAEKIDEILASQ